MISFGGAVGVSGAAAGGISVASTDIPCFQIEP
jgi:hypothetical protein